MSNLKARCAASLIGILSVIAISRPVVGSAEYTRYELHQLICRADLVVTGKIRSVDREWPRWTEKLLGVAGERREFILDVEQTVAGPIVPGTLRIHCFEDWTCAGRWAAYEKNQRVLLFLARPEEGDKAWWILGGGGEGEMPLLQDSVCVRGYAVHGFPSIEHAIGKEMVEGSLVALDQFVDAIRGFRETYVWEMDERRCFVASIRVKASSAEAEAFAQTSLTARHLHEEAMSSRAWRGENLELGRHEFPATLASIDASIERLGERSSPGADDEPGALLEALHGGLDARCAFVGDVDGDDVVDMAIGVPSVTFGGRSHGAAWILLLGPAGEIRNLARINDHAAGFPARMGEFAKFGKGLAGIGDLDGDGVPDLAVGAPGWGGTGEGYGGVWILRLSKNGKATKAIEVGNDPKIRAAGVGPGSSLGSAIANLGDIDGDGFPEIAIGEDPEFDKEYEEGRAVLVVSLGQAGAIRWVRPILDRRDGFVTSYAWFGDALAGPGDVDGDGVPDLAISNPYDSDGGEMRGAVWLVFLNRDGSTKDAKKISDWDGNFRGILRSHSAFGSSLCGPGDIDGDGISDLLVGSQEGLWTLFLTRDGTVRSHALVANPVSNSEWSFPVCIASTHAREDARIIRLALGEMTVQERGTRNETLLWALLDPNGAFRGH